MFTLDQIKAAHSKVRSGADFPAYIQDLKRLGITRYESFVADGTTKYWGNNNEPIASPARYAEVAVAEQCDIAAFCQALKEHQQGQSDYLTFSQNCARWGVEKWTVDISAMTCIYYDKSGCEMLTEEIPLS